MACRIGRPSAGCRITTGAAKRITARDAQLNLILFRVIDNPVVMVRVPASVYRPSRIIQKTPSLEIPRSIAEGRAPQASRGGPNEFHQDGPVRSGRSVSPTGEPILAVSGVPFDPSAAHYSSARLPRVLWFRRNGESSETDKKKKKVEIIAQA